MFSTSKSSAPCATRSKWRCAMMCVPPLNLSARFGLCPGWVWSVAAACPFRTCSMTCLWTTLFWVGFSGPESSCPLWRVWTALMTHAAWGAAFPRLDSGRESQPFCLCPETVWQCRRIFWLCPMMISVFRRTQYKTFWGPPCSSWPS
jgi:hypothetical protein